MTKQKTLVEIKAQWSFFKRPQKGQIFLHYKGGQYEIVATGYLEDSEAPCVVYRSLLKNIVWVRTAKNFFENVEYKGTTQPRFKLVR